VLNAIIVKLEGLLSIERRVDINTLHLPCELLLQRLERQQVVAEDQPVIENIPYFIRRFRRFTPIKVLV